MNRLPRQNRQRLQAWRQEMKNHLYTPVGTVDFAGFTTFDRLTPEQAAAHTVVHIGKPGTYSFSGKLSLGQIAVDLGEDAKKDPSAVVTLVLNGVDITCQVAPAVIFYNVYECGSKLETLARADVNTAKAGANIILPNGTRSAVSGSYVAKIYKPDSVVLSEDGTEVLDAEKLHKYDGAVYSRMSMNIGNSTLENGQLDINAANEGLDSELHPVSYTHLTLPTN